MHQFAAADLVLAERDRRHKVIHLEVLDKGVTGIEPTRRPQQSVALKSQLFRTLAHCSASRAMAVRTLVRTRLSGCQMPAATKQLSDSRCKSRARHQNLPGANVSLPFSLRGPGSSARPALQAAPNRKWLPSTWGWAGWALPAAEWLQSGRRQ